MTVLNQDTVVTTYLPDLAARREAAQQLTADGRGDEKDNPLTGDDAVDEAAGPFKH